MLWDEFTHEGRWGSALIPALDEYVGPFTGTSWLQYLSSALGLAVIAGWMTLWLRGRTPTPVRPALPRPVVVGAWMTVPLALLAGVAIVALLRGFPTSPGGIAELASRGATVGGGLLLVEFAVLAAVVRGRLAARHARDAQKFGGDETST